MTKHSTMEHKRCISCWFHHWNLLFTEFQEKLKKSIKIVSIPRGLLSNLHSTSKHWRNCGKSINLSIATQKRKTLKRTTNMQEKEVKSYKSVLFRNDFLSSSTTFRRPSSVLFLAYVNLIIECKVESEKLSANYPTHHEIIFAYYLKIINEN